jgi:hypothetical protein
MNPLPHPPLWLDTPLNTASIFFTLAYIYTTYLLGVINATKIDYIMPELV